MTDGKPKHEIQYEDRDTWIAGSSGTGIKEISLNRFQKAMIEGGKEMTGGGVQTRFVDGQTIQIAVPDQREIFINCVKMSYITIIPKIQEMKDDPKKNKIDLKHKFKMWDTTNSSLLNDHEEKLKNLRQKLSSKSKGYLSPNQDTDEYQLMYAAIKERHDNERVEKSRELLTLISLMLNHLNYFDEKGIT